MYVGDILRNKSPRAVAIDSYERISIAAGRMHASNVGTLVVRNISRTGETVLRARSRRGNCRGRRELPCCESLAIHLAPAARVLQFARHARANLMSRHQIRNIPVIDNGRLVGVVSMRDIAFAFDEAATGVVQAA